MAHGLIGPEATGAALKALRLRSGLTQSALAGKAGLHVNTVKRLEGMGPLPWTSAASIRRVSEALGASILPSIGYRIPRSIDDRESLRRHLERYNFESGSRAHAPVRYGVLVTKASFASQPVAKPKCGARTRRGAPCQRKALPNGRCKFHGGLSTGPKTPEGRARVAEAQRKRWAAWREQQRDVGTGS
jgi:transcriptional regulator with XRE-family HTH domain